MGGVWAFCIFLLTIIISIIGAHLYNSKFNNNNKDFDKIDNDHEVIHTNQIEIYEKIDSESLDIKQAIENQKQEFDKLREDLSHKKEYGQEFEEEKRKILELSETTDEAFEAWEKAQKRLGSNEFAELLIAETAALYEAGEYYKALDAAEKAYRVNPKDFNVVNWYGIAYQFTGNYKKAEKMLLNAIELADNYMYVAAAKSNLAGVLQKLNRDEEAEMLYLESLEIKRKSYEPNHPEIATSLGNLAGVFRVNGKYKESEKLYRESLNIDRKIYEPDHPSIAISLGNLAGVLTDLHKYKEAEQLHSESLSIMRKAYDTNHPKIATGLNNLANLYFYMEKYSEAKRYMDEAIFITKRTLGENHPDTRTSLQSLEMINEKLAEQGE